AGRRCRKEDKGVDQGTAETDRVGRRGAEQVPGEDRLGLAQARRPHRDRARAHGELPAEAAGRGAVGRRAGDGEEAARDRRHAARRYPLDGYRNTAAYRRQPGRLAGAAFARQRRAQRRAAPRDQVHLERDHLRQGPERPARDQPAGAAPRRGSRAIAAEARPARPHGHAQGALFQLHHRHAQPHHRVRHRLASRDRQPRADAAGAHRGGPAPRAPARRGRPFAQGQFYTGRRKRFRGGFFMIVRLLAVVAGLLVSIPLLAQEPLRIGFLTVRTGPLAAGGRQMEEGINLFLKERGNELAGRKVQIFFADTAGQPAQAKTKAQELVERERVHVLVGPLATFEALAIDEYVLSAKVPLLPPMSAAQNDLAQQRKSDYVIHTYGTAAQAMYVMGDYAAKKLGMKRVAMVADDFTYGHEGAAGFHKTFEDAGGRIVQKLWPPLNAPDYGSFIGQLKSNVDGVYAGFAGSNPL